MLEMIASRPCLSGQKPAAGVLRAWPHGAVLRNAREDAWYLAVARSAVADAWPPLDGSAWAFGHFGYAWPNGHDPQVASTEGRDGFALAAWWRPDAVLRLCAGEAILYARPGDELALGLWEGLEAPMDDARVAGGPWQRTVERSAYEAAVARILQHVQQGDVYELNYCTARNAHLAGVDPYALFDRMALLTDAPYAALLKHQSRYALCFSPESFLEFEADGVCSRPMKGTRPRGSDPVEDARLVAELASDPKERSENVMALDVARHDLSRIALPGTVQVEELCAVKTYANVHQMVSTVRAQVAPAFNTLDVVRAAWPPASMTGAPKLRAMQLIEELELGPRGLYSGSIGYFTPWGTGHLNVVIRTLMHDAASGRSELITGGAITAASDPAAEWAECELKATSVLDRMDHGTVG